MRPFHREDGVLIPLDRSDVDTDQIIPKQFLKRIERTGYGEFLFNDWRRDASGASRTDFVFNQEAYSPGTVMVAGRNFGCGSSREHAVWALSDYGIRAIVAESFADIFRANALGSGLLPVALPEHEVRALLDLAAEQPGITVAVDLEAQTVTCGDLRFAFTIDAFERRRLLEGLDDIGLTLAHEARDHGVRGTPAGVDAGPRARRGGLVKANIVVLPGDGVGPEVVNAALSVLATVCDASDAPVSIDVHLIGGRAIDELGTPLPDETLDACMAADAVLLGAVGGPAWDHLRGERRCEAGLLRLRREMDVFANVRPVKVHPHLTDRTTLRPEVIRGTDLVIVRELTGGAYFGQPRGRTGTGPDEIARDSIVYSAAEIERVARVAFRLAQSRRGELVSIDKANVLITSQLWREVVSALAAEYPDVTLTHELVDSFAMRLVREPATVDVVVAENLFGDILSDEAAVLAGSLGLLPSASLGASDQGLYEPIHGSAPSLAGRGIANPYGTILSVAMLLRHSLHRDDLAAAIESAVDVCIAEDVLTADLGGVAGTDDVADAVAREALRHLGARSGVAS